MQRNGRLSGIAAMVLVLAFERVGAGPLQTVSGSSGSSSGSIAGRVIRPDGTPASGLRVSAIQVPESEPANESPPATSLASIAITDREGRYALKDLSPGRYVMVAGALDDLIYYPGVAGPFKATVLTVAPARVLAAEDFRLPLPFAFSVRGRVVREGNSAGESILLVDANREVLRVFKSPIASDGSFKFKGLRPGSYNAWVYAIECLPATELWIDEDITDLEIPIPLSAVTDSKTHFTVVVEGGGLAPRFQLPLYPSFASFPNSEVPTRPAGERWFPTTLDVPARSCDGAPAAVPSNAIDPSTRISNLWSRKLVDFQGASIFQYLPLGDYTVSASSISLPEGYTVKSVVSGATDLLKAPLRITAQGAPSVTITLTASSPLPLTRVVGRLPTSAGTAVKAVQADKVLIKSPWLASQVIADVKADGSFEFLTVLAGIVEPAAITIDASRSVLSGLKSSLMELERLSELDRIERLLSMGLSADPIPTLIVDGDRPLSGRLLPPFRDFTELELDQSEASFLTGTSPPPPSRSITIISEGLLPPPQRSLWEVLTPVRTLAGHVIFDGESAPPEVLIRLQLIGEPTISWLPSEPVKTEPDGTFSITAPEGEYVFALSRLPFGLVFKSVTQRNADLLTQPLRVWGSNPDEVVIHVAADSKNWSTVSGRVTGVDPGRAPVVFRLTGGDLAKSFETPIHADGTFSVSGVPQGQYSLTLGGAVSRNFSEKLIIAEVIGEGVHKAEDISGLEIVVPIDSDEPAIWRRSEP